MTRRGTFGSLGPCLLFLSLLLDTDTSCEHFLTKVMDSTAALNRLLAVLTERGIGLGYDELGWLFESPQYKDSMTSWVHEYLSPATLLSLEEHDLYVRR